MACKLGESFEDTLCKIKNKLSKKNSPDGEWMGAESSEGRLEVEWNISRISIQTPNGTPYNVMFDVNYTEPSLPEGDVLYFEMEYPGGYFSMGWVSKEDFGPKWNCTGMFYDCVALTNGRHRLCQYFSDQVPRFSTVGSLIERKENSVRVYFYVDDQCLGCAYELMDEKYLDKKWYPCFTVRDNRNISYNFPEFAPSERTREDLISPGEPYKGKWELCQVEEDGVIQDLYDRAKLAIRKRSDLETELEFIFSITNHQIGSIAFTGAERDNEGFGGIFVIYDHRMGNLAYKPWETKLETLFENATYMGLSDEKDPGSRRLKMKSGTAVLQFRRSKEVIEPMKQYQS